MISIQSTQSIDPATKKAIGRSPVNRVADIEHIVREARLVQRRWAQKPVRERTRFLRRVRDYLVIHADKLAEVICRDNGKTRLDALATEIVPAAMAADYYRRKAPGFLKDRRVSAGSWIFIYKRSKMIHVPYGIIAVISPWNYPLAIPFSEVIMALAAGNAVVLKVASATQMVGRALEECFNASGLPPGLFTYINLPGEEAGNALFKAGIDKLFFTGSEQVGRQLMAKAAPHLIPLVLELGGNDPMLVCPDADLERAAAGAVWAGMHNCGQSCGGVERIYVHRSVYEPFLKVLAHKVRGLRIGPDQDHQVDLGAMTTTKQVREVRRQVDSAVKSGAVVYAQSDAPQPSTGNFLPAMVLTGVDHSMDIMSLETFGPVVGVMEVADMDQAVTLANDTTYGLTASVWTGNRRRGMALARQIEAGVVMINDHLSAHGFPQVPWGGFKRSGIGRTHGEAGMAEMTQIQCIVNDCLPGQKRSLWWHPHGPALYRGIGGMMEMLFHPRLSRRLKGLSRISAIVGRVFLRRDE
jgi:succinate-semialdehyde dehydrogenase/glutarate-semialdehyde dehydrogenase